MAKAQKLEIGGILFEKKGDAHQYLKDMLHKYKPEELVTDNDAAFLHQTLLRHPDAKEKIGCGVKQFFVRRADYNTICFWARRQDGSEVKFSYKSCL